MKSLPLLILTGMVAAAPAFAADAPAKDGTLLDLSAEARRVVDEDRVSITLGVEKQGKSAEEVQKAINQKMQDASKIYAKVDGVKVSTGGYNVWQNMEVVPDKTTGKPGKPVSTWRGNQQLVVDAPSGDKVLKLVGDLQAAGLAVQGMNYYLSREATDKLNDDLMVEALGTIGQRAERLGKALGMPRVAYEEISSGTAGGGYRPMPMMAKAMMARDSAESMPAPVGKAGETEVVVNVNAKVRLSK